MQYLLRCALAFAAAALCLATPAVDFDTSVSSEIANTMAAITGRAHHVQPRVLSKPVARKLGLSKLKTQAGHLKMKTSAKQVELLKKAEAPKQLAGYLGWSKEAKQGQAQPAFSTKWATSGAKAAKSLDTDDIEQYHPKAAPRKVAAQQEALVSGKTVTTAFSKMLEDAGKSFDDDQFAAINWGAKKKTSLIKAETSNTKTNGYLDAVGWTAPEVIKAEDNAYLRTLKEDPNKKKFLVAAEVKEKQSSSGNKYFDGLMPKYFDVEA